jgi:hypothetical protein
MLETYLKRELNYSKNFFSITEKLLNWNFETVSGKSVVGSNFQNYAHIELNIHKNNDSSNRCFINWKITNEQIPIEIGFKEVVEKVLIFFTEYFSAIRGEDLGLTFEITNGSFKKNGDTKKEDFKKATFLALINCFDKSNENYNEEVFPKYSGNEYVKDNLSRFFKSEIEISLLNRNVVEEMNKVLKGIDKSRVIDLLNLNNREELNEILFSKLNRPEINKFVELGILNKYYDLTLVGFSHILNFYDEFDYGKIMS